MQSPNARVSFKNSLIASRSLVGLHINCAGNYEIYQQSSFSCRGKFSLRQNSFSISSSLVKLNQEPPS